MDTEEVLGEDMAVEHLRSSPVGEMDLQEAAVMEVPARVEDLVVDMVVEEEEEEEEDSAMEEVKKFDYSDMSGLYACLFFLK